MTFYNIWYLRLFAQNVFKVTPLGSHAGSGEPGVILGRTEALDLKRFPTHSKSFLLGTYRGWFGKNSFRNARMTEATLFSSPYLRMMKVDYCIVKVELRRILFRGLRTWRLAPDPTQQKPNQI